MNVFVVFVVFIGMKWGGINYV